MANVQEIKPKPKNGLGWECRWSFKGPDGKRKFQKQRFRTKDAANQKKRDIENARAQRRSVDHSGGKQPLAPFALGWWESHKLGLKPSTARQYRSILNATVIPQLGHMQLASIRPTDVRTYVAFLSQSGRAAPTIHRHVGVLRLVLAQAVEDGAIADNPAAHVKLPTDKSTGRRKPEPVFLNPSEVEDLAQSLDPPYDFLVRFLAYTGLRVGEASGLNVGDVDMRAKRQITVARTRMKAKGGWEVHVPKNGKPRRVPLMTRWLQDDMRAYLNSHPNRDNPAAPLFPGTTLTRTPGVTGSQRVLDWDKPWEPSVFRRRQLARALEAANLPTRMRMHDLRHTAASIMLDRHIPPYRVAEYLGHSLQMLTTIYAHLLPDSVDEDVALFPEDRPERTPANVHRLHA